jgi:hypothetical protein
MTKILDEVLAANTKYAENFGDKGNLPLPPSRHFGIRSPLLGAARPSPQPPISRFQPFRPGDRRFPPPRS